MSKIEKAKCCGTCKHWIQWAPEKDSCLGTCQNLQIVELDTEIYRVCDKYEWSDDE